LDLSLWLQRSDDVECALMASKAEDIVCLPYGVVACDFTATKSNVFRMLTLWLQAQVFLDVPSWICIKQRLFLALHFIHVYFSALSPLYYIL
jgi:hypothetical protein